MIKTIITQVRALLVLVGVGFHPGISLAQSLVLDFDDLPGLGANPADYAEIPNGYGGLQWSNFFFLDGVKWQEYQSLQDYYTGVVSPANVAFNGTASPAEVSSTAPFYIESGYFTAVTVEPVQLQVQGFLGGVPVFDNTYSLVASGPTLLTFNYSPVDFVRFSTSAAVWTNNAFYYRDWFAMDNLSVSVVPEPSAFGIIAFGAAILLWPRCVMNSTATHRRCDVTKSKRQDG